MVRCRESEYDLQERILSFNSVDSGAQGQVSGLVASASLTEPPRPPLADLSPLAGPGLDLPPLQA